MPKRKPLPIYPLNQVTPFDHLHPMHRMTTAQRDAMLDDAQHVQGAIARMAVIDAMPYATRLNVHVIGQRLAQRFRAHPVAIRRDMLAPARRSAKDLRMDKRAERMAARMGFKPVPTTEQKISLPDDLFD